MKKNINLLDIHPKKVGNARRYEMFEELTEKSTFLPKTLTYKDIDQAMKDWYDKNVKMVTDEGVIFPTMTLYSNQRFTEYSQTWQYVDEKKNLLLNFKTITRDPNPEKGTIHGNIYNIPEEQFYTMRTTKVLDDNGSESLLKLKMRMPTAVDIKYHLSVFSTRFEFINGFNATINKLFNARQSYIAPNGHFISLTLDGVDDTSEYQIDNRQFYSQSCVINAKAYIIEEDDIKLEEIPLKRGGNLGVAYGKHRKHYTSQVDIEELEEMPEDICDRIDPEENPYYYMPVVLNVIFGKFSRTASFTMDCDFVVTDMKFDNIVDKHYYFCINGKDAILENGTKLNYLDEIQVKIKRFEPKVESFIKIYGYSTEKVYDSNEDDEESILDEHNDTINKIYNKNSIFYEQNIQNGEKRG